MKVVINNWYGRFSLSDEAVKLYETYSNTSGTDRYSSHPAFRSDEQLVRVVEELADLADGRHASLEVIEIPEGVDWLIENYEGREWVAERHRRWG